jgi:predicted RNA methylase
MTNQFPNLTEEQRKQVLMQREAQSHTNFTKDFPLTPYGDVLEGFAVYGGVWNPFITQARYHASYLLHNNQRLFAGKKALDMGTGTGLMALVMAKHGVEIVRATDISPVAIANCLRNLYPLIDRGYRIDIAEGDLFEAAGGEKYDFIVFNQPFFCDSPPKDDPIYSSMLAEENIIKRFLKEAPNYLNPDGKIMMPFFDLASGGNDPKLQGERFGYDVERTFEIDVTTGMQKGKAMIYELTRR